MQGLHVLFFCLFGGFSFAALGSFLVAPLDFRLGAYFPTEFRGHVILRGHTQGSAEQTSHPGSIFLASDGVFNCSSSQCTDTYTRTKHKPHTNTCRRTHRHYDKQKHGHTNINIEIHTSLQRDETQMLTDTLLQVHIDINTHKCTNTEIHTKHTHTNIPTHRNTGTHTNTPNTCPQMHARIREDMQEHLSTLMAIQVS